MRWEEHPRTVRSIIVTLTLASALSLAASEALAQQQPTPPTEAQVEEARNLYRTGVAAFTRGRFADAVIAFERSFSLRPHPATLYNSAEARMRAGDTPGAINQLRELLSMTDPRPDDELVNRARSLAQQMGESNLQARAPDTSHCPACPTCPTCPTCPPPPAPVRITTQVSPAAWGLAGASLALTAVGAAFLGVAIDNSDTYNTYFNMGTTDALQSHLKDQGETYRIVGITGLVLGVGAAVGAVWMFTHPRERQSPATARLQFGIGPSGMALGGTF